MHQIKQLIFRIKAKKTLLWQIDNLYKKGTSSDEIIKFIEKRLNKAKKNQLLRLIASLYKLGSYNPPIQNLKLIKKFIHDHKNDFSTDQLWKIIENTKQDWTFKKGLNRKTTDFMQRLEGLLIVLVLLQGQQKVQQEITHLIKDIKLSPWIAYSIFWNFIHSFTDEGMPTIIHADLFFTIDCDFLYELLNYTFNSLPQEALQFREVDDRMLSEFKKIYYSPPAEFSIEQFNFFLKEIEKIDEKISFRQIEKNKNETIEFIKNQYIFNKNLNIFHLKIKDEIRNEDIEMISRILLITKFKRTLRREIDQFLINHPISLYSQVKNMFDSGSEEDEKIRDFIAANLDKFSYEEMLQKIVHTYVSDTIHFAVYIATLLVGPGKLLEDIKKNYEEGNIKFDELNYLSYALQSMSFYLGVHANPILHKGLHAYVKEQAAARNKKWWQFWKKK